MIDLAIDELCRWLYAQPVLTCAFLTFAVIALSMIVIDLTFHPHHEAKVTATTKGQVVAPETHFTMERIAAEGVPPAVAIVRFSLWT